MKELLDDKMVADEYRNDIRERKTFLLILIIFFALVIVTCFITMVVFACIEKIPSFGFLLSAGCFISFVLFEVVAIFSYKSVVKYLKKIDIHNNDIHNK